VPAIHTDFVFSSLAEELGLLGSGAVLFLYLFLVMRIVRSALLATDEFLQLLTIGIGSLFAIQAIVIIGGVIKMIPMTGITMPFVSYGGSSLISSYLLIGALLGISHGGE
jgi:cell division protein FtsW